MENKDKMIRSFFIFLWQLFLLLSMTCLMLWSAYHMILGQGGIEVNRQLNTEIEITKKELHSVQNEYHTLNHRISLLREDNLDLDLLEERVRDVLNYGYENEVILHINQN